MRYSVDPWQKVHPWPTLVASAPWAQLLKPAPGDLRVIQALANSFDPRSPPRDSHYEQDYHGEPSRDSHYEQDYHVEPSRDSRYDSRRRPRPRTRASPKAVVLVDVASRQLTTFLGKDLDAARAQLAAYDGQGDGPISEGPGFSESCGDPDQRVSKSPSHRAGE